VTENEFKALMIQAQCLTNGDYLRGYQQGLHHHYHGKNFGIDEKKAHWHNSNGYREKQGYRDGFAGKPPNYEVD